MHAIVHAADIQDRDGGAMLMATLFSAFPFLKRLFADGGYQGPRFKAAMQRIRACLKVEIVKRSDQAKAFVVLPKRWIGERTLAWLGRCRPRSSLVSEAPGSPIRARFWAPCATCPPSKHEASRPAGTPSPAHRHAGGCSGEAPHHKSSATASKGRLARANTVASRPR